MKEQPWEAIQKTASFGQWITANVSSVVMYDWESVAEALRVPQRNLEEKVLVHRNSNRPVYWNRRKFGGFFEMAWNVVIEIYAH
jgi:hypothetical protein